ncbi:MAG: enoyl-CoA hydratase/isomerase family protein [Woeseiaceae bacterium]
MGEPLVTLDVTDTTTVIRLNRPARHNALVPELLMDLLEALEDERTRGARAIILAAEGPSFSTGGDLLGFWQHRDNIADYARRLVGLLNEAVLSICTHPSPVACAVQGQVTGGSLGLLLAADRVFMHDGVRITPWYSEVGFSPDGGWTAMLPNLIGHQQSGDWLTKNSTATASECLDTGIAHEVVATDVFKAAYDWSRNIAAMNNMSIESTRAASGKLPEEIRQGLEAERVAFVRQIQTPEAIAGIERFLGKKTN